MRDILYQICCVFISLEDYNRRRDIILTKLIISMEATLDNFANGKKGLSGILMPTVLLAFMDYRRTRIIHAIIANFPWYRALASFDWMAIPAVLVLRFL